MKNETSLSKIMDELSLIDLSNSTEKLKIIGKYLSRYIITPNGEKVLKTLFDRYWKSGKMSSKELLMIRKLCEHSILIELKADRVVSFMDTLELEIAEILGLVNPTKDDMKCICETIIPYLLQKNLMKNNPNFNQKLENMAKEKLSYKGVEILGEKR